MLKKIGVVSGKGGVGKTTIAISIAIALSKRYKTALVDLDISAHNVDDTLGGEINAVDNYLIPARSGNLEYVFYQSSDKQITWSGKDYADAAEQLIERTKWNNPDYMIIDFPPGTDEVSQRLLPKCNAVIIVLQPHKYSISNAKRVLELCRDTKTPIAGAIVNFAYLRCECGRVHKIFNYKIDLGIPILQEIPITDPSKIPDIVNINRILNAVNNPIILKKKRSMFKSMIKEAIKRGLI